MEVMDIKRSKMVSICRKSSLLTLAKCIALNRFAKYIFSWQREGVYFLLMKVPPDQLLHNFSALNSVD